MLIFNLCIEIVMLCIMCRIKLIKMIVDISVCTDL